MSGNQNVAVNTFLAFVHTARHTMEWVKTRSDSLTFGRAFTTV